MFICIYLYRKKIINKFYSKLILLLFIKINFFVWMIKFYFGSLLIELFIK